MKCYRCNCWPCECKDGCTIIHGDCREIAPQLSGFTACVTDPPYELGFMGKQWDKAGVAFDPATWKAIMAPCVPGAHLLAFGGTRTFHRLVCAVEDAGWQIRDAVAYLWGQGTGFPKSLDVSTAIDKAAGVEREVIGYKPSDRPNRVGRQGGSMRGAETRAVDTAPATPEAQKWDGWGTALKPAIEPITLARKPLRGTVAANCLEHGAGALNVDGCRVGTNPGYKYRADANGTTFHGQQGERIKQTAEKKGAKFIESTQGRWPANLITDGSEEVVGLFPESDAGQPHALPRTRERQSGFCLTSGKGPIGDSGSAARFFYCAKASRQERGKGNTHATVKPLALMSYLCKLLASPGYTGALLDPFMGSGSTLLAATKWFERVVGIEAEEQYCEIAAERLRQGVLL